MDVTRIFRLRYLLVLALLVGGLSIGFAAAASNTVDPSSAGDGFAEISGYDVTDISYTLNATNPQNIDSVSFTLGGGAGDPSTVKIQLVEDGSTWYTCSSSNAAPDEFSCTTTGATVAAADELRVVAAQ